MRRSVVINREFGSGGREVARMLAERAQLDFYDTQLLQDAAARRGLDPGQFEAFDERLAAGQYLNLSMLGIADTQGSALPFRMFGAIADVIKDAAREKPGVFVGRCADVILRDASLPLRSVFIYSTDRQAKIARAVEVDGVPVKDADKYITTMDKTRSRYQMFFTNTHFGELRQYDLCLNSAQLSYQQCVDAILGSLSDEPEA